MNEYLVIDSRTGAIVARCKTRAAANRSADRRDNEYGAYCYKVRAALPCESSAFKRAVVGVLVAGAAAMASAAPADSWTGRDKVAHGGGSMLIAGAVTAATHNEFLGLASAIVVGAAKEGWDSKHPGKHCASWKDFAVDVIGSLAGTKLGGLVISPEHRGLAVGFKRTF